MATVLTIAHVSRNNNDTGLKFEQVFTKLARFWEFQGKDPGVCFEAKLKGSRQGFSEGLSQAEGLQTGLQGRAFFFKEGALGMLSIQVRQGSKERTLGDALRPSKTGLQGKDCFESK